MGSAAESLGAATWTGILFVAESCPPPGTVGTSSLVVFALTVVGWFRIC